jgi:hypothetical protein
VRAVQQRPTLREAPVIVTDANLCAPEDVARAVLFALSQSKGCAVQSWSTRPMTRGPGPEPRDLTRRPSQGRY